MNLVHVADVGDGLCMALGTLSRRVIQIDVGGKDPRVALSGLQRIVSRLGAPDVFVLSHFHIDHYNGLLQGSVRSGFPFGITEVFFPRIPEFVGRSTFLEYLFAMNARVFGSETGIMEYDLLKAISRINEGQPFRSRSLSKGETINIGGSIFEILWPPKTIEEKKTLTSIKRAIDDFERAMDVDEETMLAYQSLRQDKVYRSYLEDNEGIREETEPDSHNNQRIKCERRKLPEAVKKANESLRSAANHLSLALFEDNRLLFLGDTESYEIKRIVKDLMAKDRTFFMNLITPHHGTHWHRSLRQINCINSITSNGKKLCSGMREEMKEISEMSYATFANGDVILPKQNANTFWNPSVRAILREGSQKR
jgi:hypothetical protein